MLAALIFVVTLTLVIWQPRGLGIGWSALGGAAIALAAGVIHWGDIPVVWHIVWDATFTFVALIVISLILDEAGFFRWAALHVARWGGGNGRRLFPLIVLLGAVIAAFFANDGAALILTPIVMAMLLALGFSEAATLAFVMACGFVADTTSVPLITSNLVNIVSARFFQIPYDCYALVMVPVDLIALAATLAVLWFYFRRTLPPRYDTAKLDAPASAIRDPLVFKLSFPVLGVLLLAYFISAPYGIPVSAVTGVAALILLVAAGRWHASGRDADLEVRKILHGAPWQVVLFSLGMYLVVFGLRNAGLTGQLAHVFELLGEHGGMAAALGTGTLMAGLSAVMNNMPSVLVGALAIDQAHHLTPAIREVMIYANIIGCDLGPKFTPLGSLATLLWLHVLARKGEKISWSYYLRVGLTITPPVLLVTLAALSLWLGVVG